MHACTPACWTKSLCQRPIILSKSLVSRLHIFLLLLLPPPPPPPLYKDSCVIIQLYISWVFKNISVETILPPGFLIHVQITQIFSCHTNDQMTSLGENVCRWAEINTSCQAAEILVCITSSSAAISFPAILIYPGVVIIPLKKATINGNILAPKGKPSGIAYSTPAM